MKRERLQSQLNDPRASYRVDGKLGLAAAAGQRHTAAEIDAVAHYVVEQIAPKA